MIAYVAGVPGYCKNNALGNTGSNLIYRPFPPNEVCDSWLGKGYDLWIAISDSYSLCWNNAGDNPFVAPSCLISDSMCGDHLTACFSVFCSKSILYSIALLFTAKIT